MAQSIEVVLDGKLGNQMFQYALGRHLSLRTGLPLVLHTAELSLGPDPFNLPWFRLGPHRVVRQSPGRLRRKIRLLPRLRSLGWTASHLIQEPDLRFSSAVLDVNGPCLLVGYWQSERYFEAITDQLRQDFRLIPAQDARSAACEARIRGVSSIGLHFRAYGHAQRDREEAIAFHGRCSLDYYGAALELVLSRIGRDVELFVFSDDIAWCRSNFRFPFPTTFVDWNRQNTAYEDMRLMSACRALIIANSSFSWWAGWLNRWPDKIVVAPKRWIQAAGVVSDLPSSNWVTAVAEPPPCAG